MRAFWAGFEKRAMSLNAVKGGLNAVKGGIGRAANWAKANPRKALGAGALAAGGAALMGTNFNKPVTHGQLMGMNLANKITSIKPPVMY